MPGVNETGPLNFKKKSQWLNEEATFYHKIFNYFCQYTNTSYTIVYNGCTCSYSCENTQQ